MASLSKQREGIEGLRKIKRNRSVVVCNNCRRRKIKCDKGQPCSNCVARNCAEECGYEAPSSEKAEDQFMSEIHFDLESRSSDIADKSINQPLAFVSKFSIQKSLNPLDVRLNAKKRHRANSDSDETSGSDKRSSEVDVPSIQKSEIQLLKERLEQIEKSIIGSDSKAHSSSSSAPTSSSIARQPVKYPHSDQQTDEHRPDLSYVSQVKPHHLGSGSLLGPAYAPERQFGSMLPPLNATFNRSPNPFASSFQSKRGPDTAFSFVASDVPNLNFLNEHRSQTFAQPSLTHSTRFDPQRRDHLLLGANPVGTVADTMNFYEHYSSLHQKDDLRRINFGPFAWSSLMRRDQALHLVWEHIKAKKENSVALVFANPSAEVTQENTNTILSYGKDQDQGERQFEKRALETEGIDEIIPYSSILKARKERNMQKQGLSSSSLSLGLTYFDIQIDRQLDTIEKIKTVLPTKSVIWKLVQRFFDAVYVYMPYLDEGYFREDLTRIIGSESHDATSVDELRIERKLDLAVVGILLVILRLSYLSLLSNNTSLTERILKSEDTSPDIQKMKFLLSNPISIDIINVATLCLDHFQFMRRANFTVLQLAVYLRIYHTFAPEDGDGADGGGSQILSAVILQMSYQLGLNREPDETSKNLRMNNLSRKIWYFIMLSDSHLASCFGNPMSTDERYHDTKPPFSIQGGENLIDTSKDKTIIDRYMGCGNMFIGIKDLLRETLDVKSRVSLPRITSMLSSWEIEWYQNCGSLRDCLEFSGSGETSVVDRNFKIKTYMSSRSFLITTYFHIYLHYESSNIDISFFYFKKCLLISMSDVMPHYSALLRNSEVVSDMIINPTLEMFIHKSNMVYLSGIIRVNFVIYHMRDSANHVQRCKTDSAYSSYYQRLCQLSSCLTRAAEYTISAINKISHRYYYAWRITKSQTVLLKNVTSTEFYKANYEKAYKLYCSRYSESQLGELIYICESTLASFHNSEFSTFGFSQKAETQLSRSSNSSEFSSSITPPDGVTDREIDQLWLQVLSWKHDVSGELQHDTQAPVDQAVSLKEPKYTPGLDVISTPGISTYNGEPATILDLFSDIPFNDGMYQ